jgi:hypothetical protein
VAGRPCAGKRVARGELRGGKKEDASAPIAAAAAAGRPRARYSREERKKRSRAGANPGGRSRVGNKPSSDAERDSDPVRVESFLRTTLAHDLNK